MDDPRDRITRLEARFAALEDRLNELLHLLDTSASAHSVSRPTERSAQQQDDKPSSKQRFGE